MRKLLPLLFLAVLPLPAQQVREYAQAVEFPYYRYPRAQWERELVWLKTIGIRTVAFSIPWNWHQPQPGITDITGRTSPRRDLTGLVRLLRGLGMQAWIRPASPVKGWIHAGVPLWAAKDRQAQRRWLEELGRAFGTQVEKHGGPIAFVEGAPGILDAPPPPAPIATVSATNPTALARTREAFASGRGSLLWEDVEDALSPAGWEAPGDHLLRAGAIDLNGQERPGVAALRRDAALLRNWAPLVSAMRAQREQTVKPSAGKFPEGVSAVQLFSPRPGGGSAVSILNQSDKPFRGELYVYYSPARHRMLMPAVEVPPGGALWLPVAMPLATGLCKECSVFANEEHIIQATAELEAVEFENGILAMEFAAPVAGEVVLQLSRQPSGPYLAGGKLTEFDWDEKTFRARLPIPAGKGPGNRVRIGLAIEPPEASAFFVDATRLLIGRKNLIATSYSSPELAARSRLRLPDGFSAKAVNKSPTGIDYEVNVPAEAYHGDWADFTLEADGVPMGRAHLQMYRPASARLSEAVKLHFGATELPVEPPLVAIDPKAGRNLDVVIRNNSPQIQNFAVTAEAQGFQFLPAKAEISMGGVMERTVSLRVFADEPDAGLHEAKLRLSGAADAEIPFRIVAIPRGQTVAYSADLDGDGAPEWVLESQKARAVFSAADGGRWLEYVWKDSGLNFLPESGALAGSGPVAVRAADGALEFTTKNWKRTVRLSGNDPTLTIEQSSPLPAETLKTLKQNEVTLEVNRQSANHASYSLRK